MTLSVLRAHEARDVTAYGSASWADVREVRCAGLLGDQGVVLGRLQGHYLRHHEPEHVLCFAPTRSGKGIGLVITTLLTQPASTIVHDIKGEKLPADLRLLCALWFRADVRAHQSSRRRLQSAS